jgi:hypothetical protein
MTAKKIHIEKYDFDAFAKEQKPFTMIRTDVIQRISIKHAQEFLLWVYLESLPVTWRPNKPHLTNHFNISDRTSERYMSWLNSVGLIEYRQTRLKGGTFGKGSLLVLNGSKFNPDAEIAGTVKVDGAAVNKRQKPKVIHRNDDNRHDKTGGADEASTDPASTGLSENPPERQITAPRLNGAHIKTTKTNRKEKRKTNPKNPVSVFSDKQAVKDHINLTIADREIFVEEDIVNQIVFYIGACFGYDEVIKKINIALKKVREGKWNIPSGYKGITSKSIREEEEEQERAKRAQYEEEAKAFRAVTKTIATGAPYVSMADRLAQFREGLNVNEGAMPKENISGRRQVGG